MTTQKKRDSTEFFTSIRRNAVILSLILVENKRNAQGKVAGGHRSTWCLDVQHAMPFILDSTEQKIFQLQTAAHHPTLKRIHAYPGA